MPKKPTQSYYVLTHPEEKGQRVTCVEAVPAEFKKLKKTLQHLVLERVKGSSATATFFENTDVHFGQIHLVMESGELNSAPCISKAQIMQWIRKATKERKTKISEIPNT